MSTIRTAIVLALFTSPALANYVVVPPEKLREREPVPQIQADLGLSVICVGYERPITLNLAVFVGGGIFGSYFLPWLDRGDETIGGVGDVRVTYWVHSDVGRGVYITPYLRIGYASGEDETTGLSGGGPVVTSGAFLGYAFRLSNRLDLRAGAGAQWIYIDGDNDVGASTPFLALDVTLGFRL